jgi:hypothetical protein
VQVAGVVFLPDACAVAEAQQVRRVREGDNGGVVTGGKVEAERRQVWVFDVHVRTMDSGGPVAVVNDDEATKQVAGGGNVWRVSVAMAEVVGDVGLRSA